MELPLLLESSNLFVCWNLRARITPGLRSNQGMNHRQLREGLMLSAITCSFAVRSPRNPHTNMPARVFCMSWCDLTLRSGGL